MKKQWNKDIHDLLKDFPKKAPKGLLDDIKSEMIRRGLPPSPAADKPQRLLPFVLRWIVSAAAVLFILFSLSHLWEKSSTLPIVSEYPETFQEPVLPTHVTEKKAIEETSLAMPSSNLIAKVEKKTFSPSLKTIDKEEEKEKNAASQEEKKMGKKEGKQPQNKEAQETIQEYQPTSSKPKWTYPVSKRKKSSFSFGFHYSGVVAQGNLRFKNKEYATDIPPQDSPNPPQNPDDKPKDPNHNGGADTTSVAMSRGVHSAYNIYNFTGKATHHLPVKFGLSLRYVLNERWNLQSGLTYSYLASDLEETRLEEKYDIKQKLHYLGIPLQVSYRIGEGKQFRSYIAAGGQVEKLISGKATIRHSKKNLLQDTSTQNVNDKRLLFSALASFGVEYALGETFSLYAEPSIHYYFKNGNELQTHYNKQPLNINLTIGFRVHWKK